MKDPIERQAAIQPGQQHGRVFKGVVVEYPSYNIYPEYIGKPYFSIKYTENGQEFIGYGTYSPEVLSEYLKEYFMPSAQPEQRWIPCSERLPDEKDAGILKKLGIEKRSEDVLATVEVKGERMTVTSCTYDGKWDWNMKYAFPDYKVIAWMPLPEPYQKEDQNDKV